MVEWALEIVVCRPEVSLGKIHRKSVSHRALPYYHAFYREAQLPGKIATHYSQSQHSIDQALFAPAIQTSLKTSDLPTQLSLLPRLFYIAPT